MNELFGNFLCGVVLHTRNSVLDFRGDLCLDPGIFFSLFFKFQRSCLYMQLLAAVRISVIVEHELQWGKSCLKSL